MLAKTARTRTCSIWCYCPLPNRRRSGAVRGAALVRVDVRSVGVTMPSADHDSGRLHAPP
eukprot:9495042-Pyramimonas_sp.AAC.1